jgi:hypothetical protein
MSRAFELAKEAGILQGSWCQAPYAGVANVRGAILSRARPDCPAMYPH